MWLVMGNSISDNQKKYSKPNSSQSSTKKEGQINVDYVPKESKGHDFKGGQYVDYEEVKD